MATPIPQKTLIKNGEGAMPGFGDKLKKGEIDTLATHMLKIRTR